MSSKKGGGKTRRLKPTAILPSTEQFRREGSYQTDNRHARRRAKKLKRKPTETAMDVEFVHGIRFHVVAGGHQGPNEMMVSRDSRPTDTDESLVAAAVSLDGPWPDYFDIDEVTAVFLNKRDLIGPAIEYIGIVKNLKKPH